MAERPTRPRRPLIVPMLPRLADEDHRSATPLELFFDLVFVVAVSFAASSLHHGIAEGHAEAALVNFAMMFFGIWWAWMNFTWFASSYDTDDVPYRVTVFVQMTGALIFAAGVPLVFESEDLRITVVGYVVMRIAGVVQWARAARADRMRRPATIRYGLGITLVQAGWVILVFFLPRSVQVGGFIALALAEQIIPVWAETVTPTTWHPRHIAERYGLFTIIVLGESVLAAIVAIRSTIESGGFNADLIPVIVGGMLILYAMWWLYFYEPVDGLMRSLRFDFIWSHGHYFIYSAAAAVGAGLALTVDQVEHHAEVSATTAGLAVAIPAAVYLISVWLLQGHPRSASMTERVMIPLFALLILLTPLTGQTVLLTGLLLAALLAVRLVTNPPARE